MDEPTQKLALDVLSFMDKILVGVIAIVAGVIAQWRSHNWSKEREQEKILREKAEGIVTEMYRLLDWGHHLFDPQSTKMPPPMLPRISALMRLYFPSLEKEELALLRSVMHLMEHARNSNDPQRMKDLYDELVDIVTDCSDAIHAQMDKG